MRGGQANICHAVQVTNKVLAATACIVGGCSILVVFGNHTSDTLTVTDMIKYYDRCGVSAAYACLLQPVSQHQLSSCAAAFVWSCLLRIHCRLGLALSMGKLRVDVKESLKSCAYASAKTEGMCGYAVPATSPTWQ